MSHPLYRILLRNMPGSRDRMLTGSWHDFQPAQVLKIVAGLEKSEILLRCFRKHLFVLHHAKFDGKQHPKQ